ncbi:MAG: aminodeoxychorismate/anthranilate synthase component II [Mariniphaga sp.]
MKILVIDNYDSFTYNLVHALKKFEGVTVEVKRNDDLAEGEPDQYDKIVFSPGPGLPEEAGQMPSVIRNYAGKKPMLGVCLGHQAIGESFGGRLENMNDVLHGIATPITVVAKSYLFESLPETFDAGRYHSWIVERESLPAVLEITSLDQEGRIMSFQHREFDIQGVQFHPESILTPIGEKILENWVKH